MSPSWTSWESMKVMCQGNKPGNRGELARSVSTRNPQQHEVFLLIAQQMNVIVEEVGASLV